jgi:hypothetical protein
MSFLNLLIIVACLTFGAVFGLASLVRVVNTRVRSTTSVILFMAAISAVLITTGIYAILHPFVN